LLVLPALSSVQAQEHASPSSNAGLPDAPQAQFPSGPSAASIVPEETNTSSIHGVVVDKDGSVYQGVQITLTSTSPSKKISATSDADGRFAFENLPAGRYKLIYSGQGFATQVVSLELHTGETLEAPSVTLLFSSATTDVQVNASTEEIAEAQLKEEEQQRIFGAIPNFYVVYQPNPAPLSSRQKFRLAWRTSIDPVTFLISGAFAGVEQAANTFPGYGQGSQGYAKRYGAAYADSFIDTMIGSAILPSLLKQDPRYYYKGTGTTRSRILYAIANSVICKGDNGRWQFNYSGILGGAAAGGISNLYYPAADRNGISLTLENTALGIAGGAIQNLFQEFLVRKLTPKASKSTASQP
jgi:carboxypeptidase family protein